MPLWCIRKVGKQHLVGRNVYQTVGFRIIEMMVVRCVGIENAVLVMNSDPAQQAGIGARWNIPPAIGRSENPTEEAACRDNSDASMVCFSMG